VAFALTLFLAGASYFSHAWIGRREVGVSIAVARNVPGRIDRITAFVGGEKTSWASLAAGETARAVFAPQGQPSDLLIQVVRDGQQLDWHGPVFPSGIGYRIRVEVNANGIQAKAHCTWPCWLW
jgi:hypothetical protein